MSVCLDAGNVLATPVSTSTAPQAEENAPAPLQTVSTEVIQQPLPVKTIAKLPSTANASLSKASLITVLNAPLGNVKTLCVTPAVSSNASGQFTVVNSTTTLNVANSAVKPQTITLINTPVTVVKTISPSVEKSATEIVPNSSSVPALIENRGHNVFVKNTSCQENVPVVSSDVPQSHKLLTANNFPTTNVLTTAINVSEVNAQKIANGQKSKVKILSNILMPSTSQTSGNLLLNKPIPNPTRFVQRQKILGPNGATPKYLNKPALPNNINSKRPMGLKQAAPPPRVCYPTHKSQIKTLPPVNYMHGKPLGIKTLPPHPKGIPAQIQRTGSGLRTIPPQRPQKLPNKPNYIGKHAVQAQKLKQTHKMKNVRPGQVYNSYNSSLEKQLTFNQALTAEILETLSNKSGGSNSYPKSYEIMPQRYESAYYPPEVKPSFINEQLKPLEERSKSGLDALSLICQAVLLDHNYNATLPPESPTRSIPTPNTPSQLNGVSPNSLYLPSSAGKRRTLSTSNLLSSSTSLSTLSALPSNTNSMVGLHDDDVASDISDSSDRKQDTEGEETDTAPEAEAVNNEDQFGDYVTRCICGFTHDDGYMIECDHCKVWQHVQCVVKNKQVPEEYLCELCDSQKHVDKQKARMIQQQWLRERQFLDPKLRKDAKPKDPFKKDSDSDSSDGEHTGQNNNIVGKGRTTLVSRRKSDSHPKGTRQRKDSTKDTVQRRPIKKRERKVVRRKTKGQLKNHSDDESHDTTSTHLPQLRQWIEHYEEAVTNHYSPELRARISNIRVNGAHTDLSIHLDPSVQKCRVHTQPLTELKYLVSTVNLPPNSPVIELRGKYMLSAQHRNSGSTFNTRQHAQRPGPFLFFYRLHKDNTEVCVDTRTYGNIARFVRRSCKPNAELRHSIVKGVLHLYIVVITTVEKNVELTIKHESHDLAAIGTTHISCACGNLEECTINRTTLKKNGDTTEMQKKRRGRRTISASAPEPVSAPESEPSPVKTKRDSICLASPTVAEEEEEIKKEIIEDVVVKEEPEEVKPEIKEEKIEEEVKEEKPDIKDVEIKEEEEVKESSPSPQPTPITTRRSSQNKVEKEEAKDEDKDASSKSKKLSREERKLEAILRAIAQMEKADQKKKQDHPKQVHRRESEPAPARDDDKTEPKVKRKRRKGRARAGSTNTQNSRRNRLNSTDSYLTSSDETLLSPHDHPPHRPSLKDSDGQDAQDAGLLLALSNGDKSQKSPARDQDSNSNSAQSSPETHLSAACLMVQAAVEPLEQGFKFPKTKKGLMNEWLNKVPEPVHSASSISPSSLTPHMNNNTSAEYDPNVGFYNNQGKSLVALAQVASFCDTGNSVQPRGSAKKRWLRQAISEDQGDSPCGRPDSPPMSETVAPPKKRRLPRESISNDSTTPPLTPTNTVPSTSHNDRQSVQEGCVEIVYSGADDDSPTQALESDAVLEERAAEMKEEFSKCIVPPLQEGGAAATPSMGCLMDPRLSRDHNHALFSNSEHLVGTVEKTLSILGFEDRKPEPITPAKRKLSITEYRQRKKLNVNDRSGEEPVCAEENSSSESFKPIRPRSDSNSSFTSVTSSDDETTPLELPGKGPAFNSEPTELERQREITSMRLKKAFGIATDEESRKPALDVEAILNCEIPAVVKTIPPSPTFPIPGSSDVVAVVPPITSSPVLESGSNVAPKTPEPNVVPPSEEKQAPIEETSEKKQSAGQLNLFYTPDEEERGPEETNQVNSVDYVPPFNNPIYPKDSNFTAYASVIDEEGRYEGRNPSPPPELENATNQTFQA